MEVNLLRLLQDWLDKEKFPIVSITGTTQAYIPTESIGNIWVGDYDIGIVKSDRVGIAYYRPGANNRIYDWIMAADPEFFPKIERTLVHMTNVLKRYRDE